MVEPVPPLNVSYWLFTRHVDRYEASRFKDMNSILLEYGLRERARRYLEFDRRTRVKPLNQPHYFPCTPLMARYALTRWLDMRRRLDTRCVIEGFHFHIRYGVKWEEPSKKGMNVLNGK